MSNGEVKNWDFFDQPNHPVSDKVIKKTIESNDDIRIDKGIASSPTYDTNANIKEQGSAIYNNQKDPIRLVLTSVKEAFKKLGYLNLIKEVDKIESSLNYNKFKLAVVGEFSRGKSTFINHFFNRDLLPVGNLPTTAILTKVTYNLKEMIVYIDSKGKKQAFPIEEASWDGLVADNVKDDPKGIAFVGINSEWLKKVGVEMIDTPGAGDLNEKRMSLINDALLCGDGAIITISAEQALSRTEMEFIEERLLSAKIPHLLLIVTHLDRVQPKDRGTVITYIRNKLALKKMDIPIFIPQKNLEIDAVDCSSVQGIDKIKAEIEQWVLNSGQEDIRKDNACIQLLSLLNIVRSATEENKKLLVMDEEKRKEEISQQKQKIKKETLYWEDIRLEMLQRCNNCYEWLRNSVIEKSDLLIERLQYEAQHTNDPTKWWEEDYPYRLKIELMNLASTLENGLTQIYNNDVRWINESLAKNYQLGLAVDKDIIADKVQFRETKSITNIGFDDLHKQKNMIRLGTGAATIAGYILFAGLGPLAVVTSISIGTGASVITEKIFKNKIEKQHQIIKDAIKRDVPSVIDNALAISEQRLKEAYDKVINEASTKEKLWISTQESAINIQASESTNKKAENINETTQLLNVLYEKVNKILEG